jgi:hypothetical protein
MYCLTTWFSFFHFHLWLKQISYFIQLTWFCFFIYFVFLMIGLTQHMNDQHAV